MWQCLHCAARGGYVGTTQSAHRVEPTGEPNVAWWPGALFGSVLTLSLDCDVALEQIAAYKQAVFAVRARLSARAKRQVDRMITDEPVAAFWEKL